VIGEDVDPIGWLAAAAAATDDIELGIGVIPLDLYPPTRVAADSCIERPSARLFAVVPPRRASAIRAAGHHAEVSTSAPREAACSPRGSGAATPAAQHDVRGESRDALDRR